MSQAQGSAAPSGIYGAAATLTGPVAGRAIEPLSANSLNLAASGYQEEEFFASGTASAFKATSSPSNGKWSIAPTTSAAYRTRILVRRPTDPARFNGTVVVEWMNVSSGESAPDWDYLNPELMRAGYAYVAVSAQALGVDGGTPILGSVDAGSNGGLVGSDPARYGSLHHPGDEYAMDLFAQIGRSLQAAKVPALGGLRPRHVVAVGESQSAFYLTTFADALQPLTHTFAGIFIHSRGGAGAAAERGVHHLRSGCGGLAHPNRPQRAGLHVRDADGSRRAGVRGGAPTQHQPDQNLGSGGHRPRRRLFGRPGRQPPRVHDAGQRRPPTPGGPSGIRRLQPLGRPGDAAAQPGSIPPGDAPNRWRWRSTVRGT